MTKTRDDPEFLINYSLSVPEVFKDAARYIFKRSKSLDLICLQPRERNYTFPLPSWVPNFALDPNWDMQPLLSSNNNWRASKECNAEFRFENANQWLISRGLVLDSVRYLGNRSLRMTNSNDMLGMISRVNDWRMLLRETKGDDRHALFSTLVMGRTGAIGSILAIFAKLSKHFHPNVRDSQLDSFELYEVDSVYARSWLDAISYLTFERNFFISKLKIIGLSADTVLEGDKICILLGCSLPVILCKVENHYIYLGEAYVDGYMYGKAIDELEQGVYKLEDFEIW